LGCFQFHGDEPPEFCTQFGVMSMKRLPQSAMPKR